MIVVTLNGVQSGPAIRAAKVRVLAQISDLHREHEAEDEEERGEFSLAGRPLGGPSVWRIVSALVFGQESWTVPWRRAGDPKSRRARAGPEAAASNCRARTAE